jgi:hypothetical protein
MKYIITKGGDVVLFNNGLTHRDVAYSLKFLDEVESAGFVSVSDEGGVNCYGESVSLKIKSRGDADAEFVGRHLKGYY